MMKIESQDTLDEFRGSGKCEVCGKQCKVREPAHVFSAGAGRLDIRINLVACGSTKHWECDCHSANHQKTNGRVVSQQDLLEIVAKREGVSVEYIVSEINRIRALPQPREGGPEKPIAKVRKKKSQWQVKAGELRRAAAKKAYRAKKGRK